MSKESKVLGLKVDLAMYAQVEKKATSVPYRTISGYLRELVEADLEADRKAAAEHMAKLASA